MKILVAGSDKVYAIENLYVRHLRALNADVFHFPAQSIFYDYYDRGIFQKLLFKSGLSSIYRRINKQLKDKVEAFQPDLVWIFKGMEIFPSTLRWMKARNIKLVNYNPDNPFLFSGTGSGNKHVTNSIGLFDCHFTYNLDIQEELERKFRMPVVYLPFGYEIPDLVYDECSRQTEIIRLCFLGNPDPERAAFIKKMADAGLPFDVYGHGWGKFLIHDNVRSFGPVYGEEFWRTLRRYRAQLNLMRAHNPGSHNMRSFEVPGIGGILLAPRTREHMLFFKDGEEAFLYQDVADAIDGGRQLLELSQAEADMIRQKARDRSVVSGYSYRDRTAFVFSKLKELVNG